jgi:signal transduction histidine kinase
MENGESEPAPGPVPMASHYRGRLFGKYFALILVLVCGALAASSAITLRFTYQDNKAAAGRLQREKAVAAAERIEQFVRTIEQQLAFAAQPQWGGPSDEQRRVEYHRLLRQVPAVTDVASIDVDGMERLQVSRLALNTDNSGRDRSGELAFVNAKPGAGYFGPVYFRQGTEPYMTIAVRAAGSGIVTAAEVNLKLIWDVVSRMRIGDTGKAYVIDSRGQLIADPDIGLVLKNTNLAGLAQVKAALEPEAAGSDVVQARDPAGTEVIAAFAPVKPTGWKVIVEQPVAEVYATLDAVIERSLVLFAAGLLLSAVAAWLLARNMVRPIRTLQQGAQRIGAGQLDVRIDVQTRDELQALAEQFNRMSAQLAESYSGLERKVEERTRELAVANQHKSEFLAHMSHELRTPLNAIIGFSEVLEQKMFGPLTEDQQQFVKDIHESGKHLLNLINDILDLSKVEAGHMELHVAEFDLPAAIDNAITLVKERAARQGSHVAWKVDPALESIHADERKFKQIMLNLLSNAVKFTPSGGTIDVYASAVAGGGVQVAVKDTGVGIAAKDHQSVFEEFRQVGTDSARQAEGTGLGLALVKKFVELHRGRIWLESEPQKGSTFTFYLPDGRVTAGGQHAG